jgi:hypothetical protein
MSGASTVARRSATVNSSNSERTSKVSGYLTSWISSTDGVVLDPVIEVDQVDRALLGVLQAAFGGQQRVHALEVVGLGDARGIVDADGVVLLGALTGHADRVVDFADDLVDHRDDEPPA